MRSAFLTRAPRVAPRTIAFLTGAVGVLLPTLSAYAFDLPAPSLALGDTQPADPAPASAQPAQPAPTDPEVNPRTYRLPTLTVDAPTPAASTLVEEEKIGPYNQPRWTAMRRFATTRAYVIPEGAVEVEYWYRSTLTRDNTSEARMLAEVEVGLPYRFQLDVYLRTDQTDADSRFLWGGQFEARWAFANWGEIWGNPTLYFEYLDLGNGRPNRVEPKLLLSGEVAEGWHAAANFVLEWEIDGGDYVHEYELDAGLAYTLIDNVLSVGAETKLNISDTQEARGHFAHEFYLGPSIQWKPVPNMTINIAPLIGLDRGSPYAQMTFNMGWSF